MELGWWIYELGKISGVFIRHAVMVSIRYQDTYAHSYIQQKEAKLKTRNHAQI